MGRRRKIITYREYNKLKKTSEGRQKIYLTYFFVAVLVFIACLIGGIILSKSEYAGNIPTIAFIGAGISAFVGIICLILNFVERSSQSYEKQSEPPPTTSKDLNNLNEDFGDEYDEYGGYPEPVNIAEKHHKNNTHIPENQNGKELIETNEPRVKEKKGYPSLKYYYRCFKPINPESLSYGEHPIHGLHVRYYIAIRELYKDRTIPSALQHMIELCQLDIELVCKYGTDPTYGYLDFESFKRLIIIYEKEKRFDECIELCNRALEVMDKNQANTFNIHYGIYIRNKLEVLKKKAS